MVILYETVGWIGVICCTTSSIPQIIKIFKDKNTKGLADGLIILSTVGVVCMFIYVIPMMNLQLLLSYILKLFIVFIFCFYRLFPRRLHNG